LKKKTNKSEIIEPSIKEPIPLHRVSCFQVASPEQLRFDDYVKTITVVAKTATWCDSKTMKWKSYVMEEGRIAAQVGHAVSKLKLAYAEKMVRTGATNYEKLVVDLMENPITSIVLEARDSKELIHIVDLLFEKNVHFVSFEDTNSQIYGQGNMVCTALSIGPCFDWMLTGITDHLYLWKAPGNPVS
jgi:peptidyl-tRNA hydrolase